MQMGPTTTKKKQVLRLGIQIEELRKWRIPAVRSWFDATISATRTSILFAIAAVASAAATTRAHRRRFRPVVYSIAPTTQHGWLRFANFPLDIELKNKQINKLMKRLHSDR